MISSQGYYDLVTQMYGNGSLPSKRRLVAEILDQADPLDFEPTPKKPSKPRKIQLSHSIDSPEMQVAPKEPQQTKADFLERLDTK